MDPLDRPRVVCREEPRAPEGIGAVWMTNNRLQADTGKKVCVVRRGGDVREVGFIYDLDTSGIDPALIRFSPRTPPFLSMREVVVYVLDYLVGP